MQRMQGKKRGYHGASPDGAGQALEQAEKQQTVGYVKQQIGHVVATGP